MSLPVAQMTKENMPFTAWLKTIDIVVSRRFGGLTTTDLPDLTCFADLYEEGFNVCEAYNVWKDDQICDDPAMAEVL